MGLAWRNQRARGCVGRVVIGSALSLSGLGNGERGWEVCSGFQVRACCLCEKDNTLGGVRLIARSARNRSGSWSRGDACFARQSSVCGVREHIRSSLQSPSRPFHIHTLAGIPIVGFPGTTCFAVRSRHQSTCHRAVGFCDANPKPRRELLFILRLRVLLEVGRGGRTTMHGNGACWNRYTRVVVIVEEWGLDDT